MTEEKILNGLKDGSIVPGDPPSKKFKSEQWKLGIRFLFDAATNEEITNWFYCDKCAWVQNTVLGGGTGNLLKHAQKHIHLTYKLSKQQLVDALEMASKFTKLTGTIPDYKNTIPKPEDWYIYLRIKREINIFSIQIFYSFSGRSSF